MKHHHLRDAYEVVRINLARAFQRQEQYYNLCRREWRPKIGEWVGKRNYTLLQDSAGYNAKLALSPQNSLDHWKFGKSCQQLYTIYETTEASTTDMYY
ncbi:hypothetical protein P5V15_001435 [Pogonomyrmex californicus]